MCEEPELNALVGRMLAHLYSSGPNAVVAIKKMIPEVAGSRIDEALVEMTAQRIAEIRITPEAQEGLSAFLEKRKASWVAPASEHGKKKPQNSRQDAKAAKKNK
jgi:methylglutaconyl-CoA hydratase